MGKEFTLVIFFTLTFLALGAAWVAGYLDTYQKKAQEKALDVMGENKASYGLKSMFCYRTPGKRPTRLANCVSQAR